MDMQGLAPELQIFTTADGSPTLVFQRADGYIEKMHHTGGALAESLYIYHHGLTQALERQIPPRVISVGLGLAYNELIAVAEFYKLRRSDWQIWSFEAFSYLQEQFVQWLQDANASSAYAKTMDQVGERIGRHFGLPNLREIAAEAWRDGRLALRGSFPEDIQGIENAGVVFYDAFSNKMSPELWQEQELQRALGSMLNSRSLLCTYAATGNLNRVLKNLGFRLHDRRRFRGKRNSTLAIRE